MTKGVLLIFFVLYYNFFYYKCIYTNTICFNLNMYVMALFITEIMVIDFTGNADC